MRTHLFATFLILSHLFMVVPYASANDKEVDGLIADLATPDKGASALQALEAKGKKAVKNIRTALEAGQLAPDVERQLVGLLGRLGGPGIKTIVALLGSAAGGEAVVENLSLIPADGDVEAALFARFRDVDGVAGRQAVLGWLEEKAGRQPLLDFLTQQLSVADTELRARIALLVAVRGGAALAPQLLEELRAAESARTDANLHQRLGLIETLGWIAAKYPSEVGRILPTIVQALGNADEQAACVEALVRVGGKASSALLMVLKAGDTARAAPAMEALLSIGREAAPEVVALLEARHPKIRELAHQFLSFYQDPAILPLLKALYGRSKPEERASLLKIISLYNTADAWSLVMDAAADDNVQVRLEAVKSLGLTTTVASVPVLLARAQEDAELPVRMAAIASLFRRGEGAAVAAFTRMVEYEKGDVRVALLDALAWMGGPGEVKVVAEQLRHRQSEVASAAERALWNITNLTGQKSADEWARLVRGIFASQEVEEGAELKVKTIQVAGTDFEYGEVGTGSPLLVLLPSAELNRTVVPKAYALLAKEYKVFLVPFPGCWQSKRGNISSCMTRAAKMLDVLLSTVASKKKVPVVATGVAGLAAVALYQANPGAVSHLVWANPVFPRRYHLEMVWRRSLETLDARWREELAALDARAGDFEPTAMSVYRSRIEGAAAGSSGGAMLAHPYYGAHWLLREVDIPYEDTSMEVALANVTVPMLLVVGGEDFMKDSGVEPFRAFARIHRNVAVATIDESVRLTAYEQPLIFASTAQRFITGYDLRRAVISAGPLRSTSVIVMSDMGVEPPAILTSGPSVVPEGVPPVDGTGEAEPSGGVGGGAALVVGPAGPSGPDLEGPVDGKDPVAQQGNPDASQGGVATGGQETKSGVDGSKDPGGTETAAVEQGQSGGSGEPGPGEGEPLLDLTSMGSSSNTGSAGIVEIQSSGTSWDWLGWTLVGVGGAALGAGLYFTLQAMDQADQANGLDPFQPNYSSAFDSKYADAQNQAMISLVGYGVGALAVLAGLDILIGWPVPVGGGGEQGLVFAPTLLPGGGAGFVVGGALP